MAPIYGADGGDQVPLALRQKMQRILPPRWWQDLVDFLEPIAQEAWGSARRPIFVCSSNYGIDGLYELAKQKAPAYSQWATPHACWEQIRSVTNWGTNTTILSHACVSAQLGLYKAAEYLDAGLADEVLVVCFDYVGPFVAAGFNSLKILNDQFPAPYALTETGSVGLGDGVGYAVLGKKGPGPRITAQSLYNEMYHFTSNEPEGKGFSTSLEGIVRVASDRKPWIKGHGTGTIEAGRMEAEVCSAKFPHSPLVSWKGSIGHTLGSCALVELSIALESFSSGRAPGTVATEGPCFSDQVAVSPFDTSGYDSILLLSNAFGGAHGAMLLEP
jgi:3-oxoacyl-(acyl-carrier-protein) synthase